MKRLGITAAVVAAASFATGIYCGETLPAAGRAALVTVIIICTNCVMAAVSFNPETDGDGARDE